MNDEQILKKAIEKAVENGYSFECKPDDLLVVCESLLICDEHYKIIFSHSFAKSFFGEEPYHSLGHALGSLPNWQHRLQQLVLKEQPLKYIEKFL